MEFSFFKRKTQWNFLIRQCIFLELLNEANLLHIIITVVVSNKEEFCEIK